MSVRRTVALVGVFVSASAVTSRTQSDGLTLAEVLARARAASPEIVSAQLSVGEARARLTGAMVPWAQNPQVDGAAGRRTGAQGDFTDWQIGISQPFEPPSRRAARMAGADAAMAQGTARVNEITRIVLRNTASTYYRAVHAGARLGQLAEAEELASGIYQAADRRFRAGDSAVLDVNIARAALARVRADRESASAARASIVGELAEMLRESGDLDVRGSLELSSDPTLDALLRSSADRPELAALQAAVDEAAAEVRLGSAFARPEYGVGLRYSREEGDQILLGGLTVSLPLFSTGQALRASGRARETRLRAELDAARARMAIGVRASFADYQRRREAVRVFERDALPSLDESDALARRSFEVGQLGLPELLLIRREILDTRFAYLDALLEAALARVELDARAAMLR